MPELHPESDGLADAAIDAAIEHLFDTEYSRLVRVAYLLTHDTNLAEDLVQDAFVRTWRVRSSIRDKGAIHAYVTQTLANLARSSIRRKIRERTLDVWNLGLAMGGPQTNTQPSGWEGIDVAIERLPFRKRSCLVLRYMLDMSVADTARALGISTGTVKSQTAKALELLRPHLEEKDYHDDV